MITQFILAIAVIQYLRKSLQTAALLPKWDRILKYMMYASIALLVVYESDTALHWVALWLGHALMLYIVYILYKEKEFSTARPVMLAISPFIIISLFSDITKLADNRLFGSLNGLLKTGEIFSFIWMFAMLFITNRQKKALEKERLRTEKEKEQNKVTSVLKNQLELQVAERTAELTRQKEALEDIVEELKATQAQLIQSEKMASLGELTAGIAHEIQNPLNFVNNFSEVSSELIDEMEKELNNGDKEEVMAIARDLKQNLEKINHHGKRADAIVKGMLQHSRGNSAVKEPSDLNAIADEYLRLTYHGLRAKDKSFNATMKTDFDAGIGKINILPQDIGRVLLNLFTNSFYSVTEKKKLLGEAYDPVLTITTKRLNREIEIRVRDNGMGIPQKVIDKIYQPFFTTKPTGQGTGLGLSLSYDIITKGHNGTMKVETKEGEFAEFVIQLPA